MACTIDGYGNVEHHARESNITRVASFLSSLGLDFERSSGEEFEKFCRIYNLEGHFNDGSALSDGGATQALIQQRDLHRESPTLESDSDVCIWWLFREDGSFVRQYVEDLRFSTTQS